MANDIRTSQPPAAGQVAINTWHGLTPLALLALVGLSSYSVISTALMGLCHIKQPYEQCQQARSTWGEQMRLAGVGFALLFTAAPGTTPAGGIASVLAALAGSLPGGAAPKAVAVAVRKPEEEGPLPFEPGPEGGYEPVPIWDADRAAESLVSATAEPAPAESVEPAADGEAKPKLSTAQRMAKAAAKIQRGQQG